MIKNNKTGEYEKFSITDGKKGTSRPFADSDRKAFQKQIDKKKQVTKGILKRMEKMFESFSEAAMKQTENNDYTDIDLLADGADAGEDNDLGL
jgi:hypothetical protein